MLAPLCAACEGKVTVVIVAAANLASLLFCKASLSKLARLELEVSCVGAPSPVIEMAVDNEP